MELFQSLDITDIRTHRNLSKSQLIEVFADLVKEAGTLSEKEGAGSYVAILVNWIGWSISPEQINSTMGAAYITRIKKSLMHD